MLSKLFFWHMIIVIGRSVISADLEFGKVIGFVGPVKTFFPLSEEAFHCHCEPEDYSCRSMLPSVVAKATL